MSDRETDPQAAPLDPPENTEENEMNLVQPETQRQLDPPENTRTKPE
jgi:hypothetical protein